MGAICAFLFISKMEESMGLNCVGSIVNGRMSIKGCINKPPKVSEISALLAVNQETAEEIRLIACKALDEISGDKDIDEIIDDALLRTTITLGIHEYWAQAREVRRAIKGVEFAN